MSKKLSMVSIKGHTYTGGRGILWDTEIVGLGVRAYKSGRKAYVLSYRANGRKRLVVLGATNVLTLEHARKKARKTLVDIDEGNDPLVKKNRGAVAETFRELCARYIDQHAKPHKKSWDKDEKRLKRHIPGKWNAAIATDITKDQVRALHSKIGKEHPYEANRLLALIQVIFNFADIKPNPARGLHRFREHDRKRIASVDEVKALAEAIDAEESIYIRAAIWLYLLTGARKNELLERLREDVDWKTERLRLPDTKSGEAQHIPLSPPALAILQALPAKGDNPYLFPGRLKNKHLVNISRPWSSIKERAKITDLHLHDLRRTVGSWLSQGGVELNRLKETLRHKSISTTLIYARLGEDPGKEALEEHGRNVVQATGAIRLVKGAK